MAKPPNWTRDELILALDLYFREPAARGSKSHPSVVELSRILNSLPIHGVADRQTDFRNPNGVGMKLSNFLRFDPEYEGEGLTRGSKLEEDVWNTFASNRARLREVAKAIKQNISYDQVQPASGADDDEDAEAEEGRLLTRIHRSRERSATLVAKKKRQVLERDGRLACEVCGFDFSEQYGDLGKGFAECHHKTPLSDLKPGVKTKLDDLAIVCANCHRMLHRLRPWPTLDQLTLVIQRQLRDG